MSQYLISSIFLLFVISFFIDLPVSVGVDDPKFLGCSQRFLCGDINISYPFWGGNRLKECGHPGLELKCLENGDGVEIEIDSQNYRVLNITDGDHILQLAPAYAWSDECASYSPRQSISINCTLFDCSSGERNAYLYMSYGCLLDAQWTQDYGYPCSIGDRSSQSYYWVNSLPPTVSFPRCATTVMVPIKEASTQILRSNGADAVKDVLQEGFVWRYDGNASYCDKCESSGGQCGYNYTTLMPICFCYNGEHPQTCRKPGTNMIKKLGIGLGTGIGSVLVIVILLLSWKRRYSSVKPNIFKKRNKKEEQMVEIFLENCGSMAPKRYSYSDIKKITDSFKDKIGQGGYGEVYKGKLFDGRLVAVKSLNKGKGNGEEFINEVASISRTSHVNIVSLLGFCFDGSKRALVYEFMENGSLEKFINDHNTLGAKTPLGWEALFQIALGVARGLEYLHRGCNTLILHFDIKPHNILLDRNFDPKISDFGLAKLYMRDESITSMLHARGTFGYIAPEMIYRNYGKVSHKSDVYSYGMMVLDVVGQRKKNDGGFDHSSEIYFPQWIYKNLELDEDLGLCEVTSQEEREITKKMVLVALWCIQTNPVDRPSMSRVVEMLEGKLELLSVPPKPYLSSPPRSHIGSSSTNENRVSLLNL